MVYKWEKELYTADTLSRDALEKTDSPDLDSEIVFRLELLEMCIKPSMMSNDTLKKYMRKRKRIQP